MTDTSDRSTGSGPREWPDGTPKTRCTAHARSSEERCRKAALPNQTVCELHGGKSPAALEAALVRSVKTEMQKFVELAPADDWRLDPFNLLVWEVRRTIARIDWYDERLADLRSEKDLIWGLSKKERISATEFAGTNRTYEARENKFHELQRIERARLERLMAFWQNSKFEAIRVASLGGFQKSMRQMVLAVMQEFEIDAMDPEVQKRVQKALEGVPDPIPAMPGLGGNNG
jgi:hypothetical protein